jgi:hypothetical protein
MDDRRRYSEAEIRKIFESAGSSAGGLQRPVSSAEGLTLPELQSIGSEIGFSHQQIADAAAALTFPSPAERRSLFGMPVGVSSTASLPRLPDDREWELLLVDLRATFGVQGEDRSQGNLREWANGTLLACVEPSINGSRLRLASSKRDAVLVNGIGVSWILVGLITLITLVRTGDLAGANSLLPVICGVIGGATLVYNGFRLRRWKQTFETQMRHIIDRAQRLLTGDSTLDASRET